MVRRAAIYARISDDPSGEGRGVERQVDDCRKLIADRGWDEVACLIDNDTSAYSAKSRPGYDTLMKMVRSGELDVIVAWNPDRLHRRTLELEHFIDDLEQTGTTVSTVKSGEYDLSTPNGRMAARIVGAVSRQESETKAMRLKRQIQQAAESGKPHALAGFGYDRDYQIVEDEAALIRSAVAGVLAGTSVREVCRQWDASGIRPRRAKSWQPSAVQTILTSERIAGLRIHRQSSRGETRNRRGGAVTEATWEPIIDRAQHEAIKRLFADPSRRTNSKVTRYLLTGVVECGRCGARLVARPSGTGVRGYICAKGPGSSGCNGLRINAERLEELFVEVLFLAVDEAELAALATPGVDTAGAVSELEAIQRRRDDLAALWASGELDDASWSAARGELDRRTADANRVLSAADRHVASAGMFVGLRESWQGLSFGQHKTVVAAAVETIVIGPAKHRGPSPVVDRILDIKWQI